MRYFVTGASGWIGSALTRDLIAAGHQVVGVARSDASAAAVESLGAEVFRGSLDDPAGLAEAAAASDGVAHLAFVHDFTDFTDAARVDREAIEAIGGALAGSGKPFTLASGVVGMAPGRLATEETSTEDAGTVSARLTNERVALDFAARDVRTSSLRFAPTVHGVGDHGFIAMIVQTARDHGFAAYVGDGTNRWPAVHQSDAARLGRLALEKAPAGTPLHAVAEQGVAFRDVAEAIGRKLDIPTRSIAPEQAVEHFGFLGAFAGVDSPVSSDITQRIMGWTPTGPTLLEDVESGAYTD